MIRVEGDTSPATPHSADLVISATAPGWYVHPARAHLVVRRSWRASDDGPLTAPTGSPVTINAFVREDRGRNDVTVRANLLGRDIPLERTGDGRYTATVTDELPFGLHWARITARAPDGGMVSDSVRVYVRPGGWIRVPDHFAWTPDSITHIRAWMETRMGTILGQPLPLVAVVRDAALPLRWNPADSSYALDLRGRRPDRVVIAALIGDPQRRVVRVVEAAGGQAGRRAERPDSVPVFASAVRFERAPVIDADLGEWGTTTPNVTLGPASSVLTDSADYHGAADLSGTITFGWDDSTLYVAGQLTDDSVTTGEAWDVDRVNLVFDMKDDTSPITYSSANPPLEQWQDDDYWIYWRAGGQAVRRAGKTSLDPIAGARIATRRTPEGWAFEVAIPRAALPGYVPFVGQVAGLQVFVTDGDGERAAPEIMWAGQWPYPDGIEWRLAELAHLLFVDAPRP